MKYKLVIGAALITVPAIVWSQKVNRLIQQGNDLYKSQQYDKAAAQYADALKDDPGNRAAKMNLATALYKQGKPDEAIKLYTELAADAKEPAESSQASYNTGAVLSRQKRLEESIEAYKKALRQNPDDKDARENLQKALLELKKKNPPPPKKENKKKQDQQQKQQPQSKLSPKEAEQRLRLLEQKEKEVQQRLQKEKTGGGNGKDW